MPWRNSAQPFKKKIMIKKINSCYPAVDWPGAFLCEWKAWGCGCCTWECDGAAPVPWTPCRARLFTHSPWGRGKSSWGASSSPLHCLQTVIPRDGEARVCGGRGDRGDLSKVMIHPMMDPCVPWSHLLRAPHLSVLSSSDEHRPVRRKERGEETLEVGRDHLVSAHLLPWRRLHAGT